MKNLTEEPSTTQITVMQQENKTEESINTKIIIGAVTLLVACIGLSVAVAAYCGYKRARSGRVQQEADLEIAAYCRYKRARSGRAQQEADLEIAGIGAAVPLDEIKLDYIGPLQNQRWTIEKE